MHVFELMAENPLVWTLFALYLGVTSYLAWMGHRKTQGLKSYAIGGGTMNPWIVGITLAASIASSATFTINPGFIYAHGFAALAHYGGAVLIGITAGLVIMSTGFRRLGASNGAVTLPQWIGNRFESRGLSILFAAINLLSLAFVVLIIGGSAIVMQSTLGLTNTQSLVVIVVFVFGYVFIGGTYAHAYTNTLQGGVMVVISVIVVASGLKYLGPGMLDALASQDPNLIKAINPGSSMYNSFFSIYVSGIVIGFALVCQPHILTKALYVKDDRDVRRYLAVTIVVSVVFAALLLVGLYARLADIPATAFLDASGNFRQDLVVVKYLEHTFSPSMLAVVAVALLAAGMSTLDGILVALSSIAANDLFTNLMGDRLPKDPEKRSAIGHRASQVILVLIGIVAFVIALHPPKLLGIFGQVGVYGIVAASAVPIVGGIFLPRMNKHQALIAVLLGLGIHFGLYFFGPPMHPGVTATWAILASSVAVTPALFRRRQRPTGSVATVSNLA